MSKAFCVEKVFPGSVDEIEQADNLDKIKELVLENSEFVKILEDPVTADHFEKVNQVNLPFFDETKIYYVVTADDPAVVQTNGEQTTVFKRDSLVVLKGGANHEVKNPGEVTLIEISQPSGDGKFTKLVEKASVLVVNNSSDIKATVLLASLLLIQILLLAATGRSKRVYEMVCSRGLLLFTLGLFIFLPLVYLVPNNVRMDTDAGYIWCRHLRNLPMPISLLLGLNILLAFFYFSYARYGSLQPIPIGLGAIAILSQFLMGFTMDIKGRAHEAAMATMFGSLFALLLFSFYINWFKGIFLLIFIVLAVVAYNIRNNQRHSDSETLFNEKSDLFFAAICFTWIILIPSLFTLGHHGSKKITVAESISMNLPLKVILLLWYIGIMTFYAVD